LGKGGKGVYTVDRNNFNDMSVPILFLSFPLVGNPSSDFHTFIPPLAKGDEGGF